MPRTSQQARHHQITSWSGQEVFEKQYIGFEQPATFDKCMLYCRFFVFFSPLGLDARQAIKKNMIKVYIPYSGPILC